MHDARDGESSNNQELAALAMLPYFGQDYDSHHDYVHALLSRVVDNEDCEDESVSGGQEAGFIPCAEANDGSVGDDPFGRSSDFLGLYQEETLSPNVGSEGLSQSGINHELPHYGLSNNEFLQSGAANLSAQCMDDEILFLTPSKQQGIQSVAFNARGFFSSTSSAQDSSQSATRLSDEHVNRHGVQFLPSPLPQDSQLGTRADHQTYMDSLDLGPDENCWQSGPVHKGEALEPVCGSVSLVPMLADDEDHLYSDNVALESVGPAQLYNAVYSIDNARPSQSCGSVLASEAKFTGSIPAVDGIEMVFPGPAVHPVVIPRSDVVDLTEESDEDDDTVECMPYHDLVEVYGKRRMEGHLESDKKKRLNFSKGSYEELERESFHKPQISRSKISTSMQADEWQKSAHYLEKDPRTKIGGSNVKQVQQPWNLARSSNALSCGRPDLLLDHKGRTIHSGKNYVETMADRGRLMQLAAIAMHGSNVTRSLPVSLGGPATPAALSVVGGQSNKTHPARVQGERIMQMQGSLAGSNSLEEATPGDGLMSVPLLKHQRLALAWMERRELGGSGPQGGILADDQGLGKTISTISLILKARAPIQKTSGEAVDYSQCETLTVNLDDDPDDELKLVGGTNEVAAKIVEKHSSLSPATVSNAGKGLGLEKTQDDTKSGSSKGRPAAGNLVVCPTSVLKQWAHELKEKVTEEAGLSVLIYHGSNRTKDPDELARHDVVLTTYSIVSMEVPKQPLPEKDSDNKGSGFGDYDFPHSFRGASKAKKPKKSTENGKKNKGNAKGRLVEGENGSVDSGPLARVNWFRVILDEAQSIKNARTQVARAAWGLRAKRRWCLSGTPIQNAIDDLYSYFRFLRYFPFDGYKMFRERIKDPVTRTPSEGYKILNKLLTPVMLRRTKATLIDGQPIVNLPPRIVTLKQTEFNDEERAFYANLETESKRQFEDYAAAGTLQSNYVNILWMLLRLRQACDHPLLVKGHKSQGVQKVALDSARKLPAEQRRNLLSHLEGNRTICTICNDLPDEAVVCICTHIFCRQCIIEQLAAGDDHCCPIPKCRKALSTSLVFTLASLNNCERSEGSGSGSLPPEGKLQEELSCAEDMCWKSSSKIDAVIDTLSALPAVFMIVENGKVVVQASKDLKDVKLVEPDLDSMMKHHRILLDKSELVSVVEHETRSADIEADTTDIPSQTSSVNVEKFEAGQTDMANKTETLTRYSSTGAKVVKHDPLSRDIVSIREPVTRKIVESTEKAIVFSQWTSMLDLLEVKLKQAKFNYRRLDGTMSVLARDRAVSEFKTLPEVTVIIMSLKAASLGLNMVAACHVLLLDVWWNPTTEDQAIDRAHRIGQTRTVRVSRFTVKDTIEDRILELQEKKREIVAAAFGENEGGGPNSRLTFEDLQFLFA